MNIVSVKNLTKSFGGHTAIEDISFEIPKGTIVGLLGPNGAGKTTLIRSLTKIIEPDQGTLSFDNEAISLKTATRFGYLPEERGLYKKMKVGEHLLFLARLKGLEKKDAIKKIKFWLARFSIEDWRTKKVEDLSKGMQQKVQFIASVLHEPELLILDEPFSGFDPVNTEIITQEILTLRNKGVTIIFSTHRMESIDELCDHILFINKSKLILSGGTKEIKEKYRNRSYKICHSASLPDSNSGFDCLSSEKNTDNYESIIQLNSDLEIKEIMSSLWSHQEIFSFEEKIPTVKEIFIKEVSEEEHNHG